MKKILLPILFSFISLSAFSQGVGCPGVEASPDQTLPCNQECTQISATVFAVGETTSYGVNSIPHAPPIAYNAGGGTAVSVNTDDVWSSVIPLPFPFCFFGETYNEAKIGSNGAIKLGPVPLTNGGYHPWPFTASVPSAALVDAGNIFGPYHDIDPSVAGNVRWYLTGQAPCRTFIVSFNNLGHYSCTNLRSTHMMVLYETTNVIEVYVERKQTCNGWNSGNTVIGIQNNTGTVGYTPPGRNTGNWTVNTPEAWQFVPSGSSIVGPIEWFDGATLIGTGDNITVCPTASTTYTARAIYTRCDGLAITCTDDLSINFTPNPAVNVTPQNPFSCSGQNITLTANSPNTVSYDWSSGQNTSVINVSPLATTTYTVTVTDATTGCEASASTTVNISQPISTSCNVLYVTPTGLPSADGTRSSPLDLSTALKIGACNGTIIKMAIGDYVTDTTITGVTSYLTLEGGYDSSIDWEKVSTAGATRILKTATMTTSTSNGSGIEDENGLNPRSTAIEVSSQTGFRFQDLTVELVGLAGGSPILGYNGVSMYGVQLNACDDYNIVRTQIIGGAASNGSVSAFATSATDGGSSFGLSLFNNGSNANVIQSNITAGAFGLGGSGTPPGANGISQNIQTIGGGVALVQNQNSFNLSGQPTIIMDDLACTATNIGFRSASSNSWNFGTSSSPLTATGSNVITQYSTIGRKSINYAANDYIGFANIILDDQVIPAFTTSAPFIQGQYRVCAGETVTFTATNGGIGYVYIWDIEGNVISGTQNSSIDIPFSTQGIYNIQLQYETSCCGLSLPVDIDIYVEEIPQLIMPSDEEVCLGSTTGVVLTISGALPNGTISWSPSTGLSATDTSTVVALPTSTTTYTVTLTDSTGLCSDNGSVAVTVIDLILTPASTPSNCSSPGTAEVVVDGGTGNYSYQWSNGETTQIITGLQPGDYSVNVIDNNTGCTDSIMVNVPAGPGALVGEISSSNISCAGANDGQVSISVTGGTAPYTYNWTPVGGTVTTPNQSETISNLGPGDYSVLVADAGGCEYDASITLSEPTPIIILVDSVFDPTCQSSNNGYIRLRADGGFRPYNYLWSNGVPVVLVNDDVIGQNLSANIYTLTLTDARGCVETIDVTISASTQPVASIQSVQEVCSGDSSNIVIGGTPEATVVYNIGGGANQSVTLDAIGQATVTTAALTDNTTVNLVSVTSPAPALCVENLTATDTITVIPLPTATITATDVCSDNSTDVLIEGPAGATVSYTVNGGGVQTVTLNAQGQSTVNTGAVTLAIVYQLTNVTTAAPTLCSTTLTASATVNPLPLPTADISGSTTICQGESTVISFTGTPNTVITYTVNGGANQTINLDGTGNAQLSTGALAQTTIYSLVSVDNNGCINSATGIATITINPSYNQTVSASICSNETYTLPNGQVISTQGTYPVTLQTAAGCDSVITTNLTVNQLGVSNPLEDISVCEGFSETVTVDAQNMVTYEWVYNTGSGDITTVNATGFEGGETNTLTFNLLPEIDSAIFTVRMTDACGNLFTESFTLRVYEPSAVENPIEDIEICLHELPQTLTIDYDGYNYQWSDGTNGASVQITEAGEYIVNFLANVTNCRTSDTIVVTTEDCIANCVVLAPTGFTPDENGKNDIFRVVTNCDEGFQFFEFRVYNRWGELVYMTNNHRQGWDGNYKGRTAEIGVYTYYVEYVKNLTNKNEMLKGNVTLIR